MKLLNITIVLVFVNLLSCVASPDKEKESKEKESVNEQSIVAVSFSNKQAVSKFKKSGNAKISSQKGNWIQEDYALIELGPRKTPVAESEMLSMADAGDTENPTDFSQATTAWIEMPLEVLKKKNQALSAYDILRFKTYNPGNERIEYSLNLKDSRGAFRPIPYFVTLEPKEEKVVELYLRKKPYSPRVDRINRYVSTDSKNVNLIEFTVPYAPKDMQFYVSKIELIKGSVNKLQAKSMAVALDDQKAFNLIGKSSMEQVFLEKSRLDLSSMMGNKLYAAKNEQESMQVVIVPNKDLNGVKWSISAFENDKGQSLPTSVSMVGYVDVNVEPRYTIGQKGWYPDPILDSIFTASEILEKEILPLYVKVDVPLGAEAGMYRAILIVEAENGGKEEMSLDLEVWNFSLPVRSSNTFIGQFYRLNSISQFLPPKDPSSSYTHRENQQTKMFEDWMLKNRMQPGNLYAGSPPNWSVSRLKELVDNGLSAVNMSYVRIDRKEANNYDEKAHWKRVEEQVERMRNYIPKLKEAGLWERKDFMKYVFLFDEWPGNRSKIVYETAKRIKAEFPELTMITTMSDHSYGIGKEDGEYIDIWVPHVDMLQRNKMYLDYAKSMGKRFGWYLAVGSYAPYPNVWVENEVIQSRISMGALSYHYDTPLFVYWAFNRWHNNNPRFLEKGPKTRWKAASYGTKAKDVANGEGSLFYARLSKRDNLGSKPVATLRSENIRDGLEDFEYYVLLEKLTGRRIDVNKDVLENVAVYTNDPQKLQEERIKIAQEILKHQ